MLPASIFRHVLRTLQELPMRPVVLVCGDNSQQHPITTVDGKTKQTISALADTSFMKMAAHYNLTT